MAGTDIALWSTARVGHSPCQVVARITSRKSIRSALLWGYVFGLTVASSALGYVSAYPTLADRTKFAATFGTNAGLDAITGPANDLQSVAGYTEWKSLAFLSVVGGIWGLLIATRLLRGEEDAGRFELLLAGQTTKRRATMQVLVGLGSGLGMLFAFTAVIAVVIGKEPKVRIGIGSMVFFAVAIVSSAAVFLAVGALTSQLAATRRQAAGYAGAALGISYALRMIADSGSGLTWLRWVTPLGWVEELQPLTSPRPLALLPILALTTALVGGAVHLAGNRDLGASILSDHSRAKPHTRLLSGSFGLTARLGRGTALVWTFAIAGTALLLGFVAKQAGSSFTTTPSIEKTLHKLGLRGGGAQSYLGLSFLIVAVLVAFVAVGQITATRGEESDGHVELFLVRPVARLRWLGGRLAMSTAILIVTGITAGLFTWFGSVSQHAGIGIVSLLAAGANLVPPALFILGIGGLAFGAYPRSTGVAAYGVLVWSFLVDLIGSLLSSNHWFLDTSVFRQMAPAPGVSVNWTTDAALVALGLAAALVGGLLFRRRDLASA